MLRWVFMLGVLTSCAPAGAGVFASIPAYLLEPCGVWPRELKLKLPTDTVPALQWHDENKKRWYSAYDECRDNHNELVKVLKQKGIAQ